MLPLPFLRVGPLMATAPGGAAKCGEVWRRDLFILDQRSLRVASGIEGALSSASASAGEEGRAGESDSSRGCEGGIIVVTGIWMEVEGEAGAAC